MTGPTQQFMAPLALPKNGFVTENTKHQSSIGSNNKQLVTDATDAWLGHSGGRGWVCKRKSHEHICCTYNWAEGVYVHMARLELLLDITTAAQKNYRELYENRNHNSTRMPTEKEPPD